MTRKGSKLMQNLTSPSVTIVQKIPLKHVFALDVHKQPFHQRWSPPRSWRNEPISASSLSCCEVAIFEFKSGSVPVKRSQLWILASFICRRILSSLSAATKGMQPKSIAVRGHLSRRRVRPVIGLQKMGLLEVVSGLSSGSARAAKGGP